MTDREVESGSSTDRVNLEAMLKLAGIGFDSELTLRDRSPEAGAVSIHLENTDQTFPGGYSGFSIEMVFSKTGRLLAIWSWE